MQTSHTLKRLAVGTTLFLTLLTPTLTHAATYSAVNLIGPPGCKSTSFTNDGSGGMFTSCHGTVPSGVDIVPADSFSVTITSGGVSKSFTFGCSGNTLKEAGASPECADSENVTVNGENLTISVDSKGTHATTDPEAFSNYAEGKVKSLGCISAAYKWNGTECLPVTFSCTGTVPSNATLYADYNTGLTKDTAYSFADPETGKCQYKCSSGHAWNGTSCVSQYSCLGTVPANGMVYNGDDTNLTSSATYTYSLSNTAAKCEYNCKSGYTMIAGACVPITPPTYSCTTPPTVPANATVYTGDETNLTANTPYSYSDTNTGAKCEYHCNAGYDSVWNGTKYVCQAQATGPDLIAGSIFPTSWGVNSQMSLNSTVKNQGDEMTSPGASNTGRFMDLFQLADSVDSRGNGVNVRNLDPVKSTVPSIALAAKQSTQASILHTFAAAGTYYVRACADKSSAADQYGVVDEKPLPDAELNNCGEWTPIVITDTTTKLPDLIAGGVTPTSASINIETTLSAPITNQGQLSTEKGFSNLWQQADDLDGKNTRNLTNSSSDTLDMGQSAPTSIKKTFTTTGAYFFRVCADDGSGGAIGESDEGNNCGPYTEIDVGDDTHCTGDSCGCTGSGCGDCTGSNCTDDKKVTVTLTADKYNVNQGESTYLNWKASDNATYCQGNIPGFGSGYVNPISGRVSTGPLQADSPYQVQCKGDQNNYSDPAAVLIKVNAVKVTIDANPPRVKKAGEHATVTWTASDNAKGCVVSGPGISAANGTPHDGLWNGLQDVIISAPSTYWIICNGAAAKASVTVNIVPDYNEF